MIRSYKGITPQFPTTCYVDESAQLIGDIICGEHSSVWMNAVLRGDVHEIRVGHYSNIQDNSVLHGMTQQYGVYVGDYVTVGHSVVLHGCKVEGRCLIGMGSPGKFVRKLVKEDEDMILRYTENYIGYKKAYLLERKSSG